MEELIAKYFELLSIWNRKIRLVSKAASVDEFEREHVQDARRLAPLLADARSLIDIGTGAGLPGMLIKIMLPDLEVVLIDSIRKKVSFCDEAIRSLGLNGIRAVCGRAEDEGVREALGAFDAVVSRATWKLKKYIEISAGYMKCSPSSRIYALKGAKWSEELSEVQNTLETHGLMLDQSIGYALPDSTPRRLLSFRPK